MSQTIILTFLILAVIYLAGLQFLKDMFVKSAYTNSHFGSEPTLTMALAYFCWLIWPITIAIGIWRSLSKKK